MTVVVTVLAVIVAVQLVLIAGLLRSHGEILRRLHDLGAGTDPSDGPAVAGVRSGDHTASGATNGSTSVPHAGPAPAVEGRPAADLVGTTPAGEARAVSVVGTEHDTVVAFLSSSCAGCRPYWEALADDPGLPERTRLVVVTREEPDEDRAAIGQLAPAGVTVVMSDAGWDDHDVPGSPYVVHVDGTTGRVRGEGTAASWPAVRKLLLRGEAGRAGGTPSPRAKAVADARRERDADRHLLAAGIAPGDASLYRRADGTRVDAPEVPESHQVEP